MASAKTQLLRYLDAKQHLWNSNFLELFRDIRECEPLETFEKIDNLLFKALVRDRLAIALPDDFEVGKQAIREIAVRPQSWAKELALQVERPSTDGNRYWSLSRMFASRALEMSFVDFFQWDSYGFLAMSKVRCLVERCRDPQI